MDILFEETAVSLCKGYNADQLRELHEKIKILEGEVIHQLDYDSEVQEIIGACCALCLFTSRCQVGRPCDVVLREVGDWGTLVYPFACP